MRRDSEPPGEVRDRERRRSVRLPVVNLIWYRTLEDVMGDPLSLIEGVSKMCDISHNGVGMITTRNLALGRIVFVEVTGPKFSVSALGEVVFNKVMGKNYYRIGIRFIVMPPNNKITLDNFIRSNEND